MPYPKTGNLAPAFTDLAALAAEIDTLRERANAILADIRPALIGQRVAKYGRTWQITQVQIWGSGRVTCYAVRVSKKGKVGTRSFDLGNLDQCEFIHRI